MNCSNVKWVAVLKEGPVTDEVVAELSVAATQAGEMMQWPKFVEKLRLLTGAEHMSTATKFILIEDGKTEMPPTDKAFYFIKYQDLQMGRCYIGNVPQHHKKIQERVSTSIQV